MPRKAIRIPEKMWPKIEADMKDKGTTSEQEWYIEAFSHFLKCKKAEPSSVMHTRILKWPAKCIQPKCGRHIEAGEWALYGRGLGAICLECYIQRMGDKALLAKYLKMREYKAIIKALENEADRLALVVEQGQAHEKLNKLHEMVTEFHRQIMSYMHEGIATDHESKQLEKVIREASNLFQLIENLRLFLEQKLKKTLKEKGIIV